MAKSEPERQRGATAGPSLALRLGQPENQALTRHWYGSEEFQDLPDLLAEGWLPVRETMMGGGSGTGGVVVAFSLVLLESDVPLAEAADTEHVQEK